MERIASTQFGCMVFDKFIDIPKEYREDSLINLLKLNIKREKNLSIVLLVLNAFLYLINNSVVDGHSGQVVIFGRFCVQHVLMSLFCLFFLLICYNSNKISRFNYTLYKILHILICTVVLNLCAIIAVNNAQISKEPYSFLIAVFCMVFSIYFNQIERIIIFGSSFMVYGIGIMEVQNKLQVFENLFFVALILVLAIYITNMNFNSYVKNDINNKIIVKKNRELDFLYKITEKNLKERTDELNATIEYERLRTAFFTNISHEFRTPLNLIYSAEQMIEYRIGKQEQPEDIKGVKEYTNIIRQNCHRLIRLIANFIDVTKIDSGYLNAEFKNIDIVKVVEDITMSAVKYVENKGMNLIFDTEIEEKVIACDPDKIERIMLNLLSNAIKFTNEAGSIAVSIYDRKDRIAISVKDTGIGIPEHMQKHIFDRFVQVDKTTSRNREGSGIGLSLVKALAEMHNGSISLNSKEGFGSEFIVEIPVKVLESCEVEKDKKFIPENKYIEKINIEFSDIYSN